MMGNQNTNIFDIQQSIVSDYQEYVNSFINIRNDSIREAVQSDIDTGKLWPEALIQFNPSFEHGDSVHSLIDDNIFHSEIQNVFSYPLYKHQVDAIKLGNENKDFTDSLVNKEGKGKVLRFSHQLRKTKK